MSAPRNTPHAPINVPSHSSSPSKSSLRRVSGGTQQRSLLPSPHFHEPVISASYERSPEREEAIEYSQHDNEESVPQPTQPFQPFFTLIEDTATREHFHPTVHYIFADDEADIITEAALKSLDTNQRPQDESTSASTAPSQQPQERERYLSPTRSDMKEHYIILDVQPTPVAPSPHPGPTEVSASASGNVSGGSSGMPIPAYEVTNAYSTSAEWQVLRTSICQAPTLGDNAEDEGLMLRIEGRGNTPPEQPAAESIEEMIERFERGLEEVRLVMESGGQGLEERGENV